MEMKWPMLIREVVVMMMMIVDGLVEMRRRDTDDWTANC